MKNPKKVKKLIYIDKKQKMYRVLAIPTTVPRLRYHGIDPETIAAIEVDVYIPAGEWVDGMGYPMVYSHSHL